MKNTLYALLVSTALTATATLSLASYSKADDDDHKTKHGSERVVTPLDLTNNLETKLITETTKPVIQAYQPRIEYKLEPDLPGNLNDGTLTFAGQFRYSIDPANTTGSNITIQYETPARQMAEFIKPLKNVLGNSSKKTVLITCELTYAPCQQGKHLTLERAYIQTQDDTGNKKIDLPLPIKTPYDIFIPEKTEKKNKEKAH